MEIDPLLIVRLSHPAAMQPIDTNIAKQTAYPLLVPRKTAVR
jgi:hypothetical protein